MHNPHHCRVMFSLWESVDDCPHTGPLFVFPPHAMRALIRLNEYRMNIEKSLNSMILSPTLTNSLNHTWLSSLQIYYPGCCPHKMPSTTAHHIPTPWTFYSLTPWKLSREFQMKALIWESLTLFKPGWGGTLSPLPSSPPPRICV